MVDQVTQITPAPTSTPVDPAAVAVVPAPSVVSETSPSIVQPVSTPEATTTPATAETALGAALDKPVEAPKTEDTKPAAEAPKVEAKVEPVTPEIKEGSQSAEPAPPPTYETFKVPEGVNLQPEGVSKFTAMLAELETEGKTQHELVQKFGQKAVDFYVSEIQTAVKTYNDNMQSAWTTQKNEWKESFLKDNEIGGERSQATLDAASKFIRTHGGTAEQQKEFKTLMETSGLGNHPAMIRLLAKAGEAMSEGKPLAASKPANTSVRSKVQTMYGKLAST